MRFGFRLLYNEMAFTYDTVSMVVSLGAWRCWQRAALKHLHADGCVLELAHGTGDLQIDLKQAGYETVGYDLSTSMGRIARRKLHRSYLVPTLVQGRAQQLPFATQRFSAVVSTFPTPFIIQPDTLSEIRRVLVDDGMLVIVPSGTFVGRGAAENTLELLYRITGQREGAMETILKPFYDHGFETQLVHEDCPRSVALVVIARKKV